MVTDSLTEFAYDAELTSLAYSFIPLDVGLYVALSGYNDKLHVLAKTVFEKARNLVVMEDRLNVIKASVSD